MKRYAIPIAVILLFALAAAFDMARHMRDCENQLALINLREWCE